MRTARCTYSRAKIHGAMLAAGLDQKGLADAANLSERTVSNILHTGALYPPTIKKIATALQADLGDWVIPVEEITG